MKQRKYVVLTLVIIMIAVIALSVNTALAAGSGKTSPSPLPDHAPLCYKVNSFAPGVAELQCSDTGKDIVNVSVKTNAKYDLIWDDESVTLRVYVDTRDAVAIWFVQDKVGNVTTGRLP